jgi:hypothetical protein
MSFVYDIAELSDLSQFVYDVKILYQLKGYKVRTLTDLLDFLDFSIADPYRRACDKIRNHIRSYVECGIPVHDYKISQIIPHVVLDTFTETKQGVLTRLFDRFHDEHVIQFYEEFFPKLQCLHRLSKHLGLKFNFVGSKTGRLSFKQNTFNPYVLPKSKRNCIEARPGHKIYQYDLKSSQPRIAIFSTYDDAFKQQFLETDDIYSVFPGDRHRNKISFLRWMYSLHYTADERFGSLAKPIKELRSHIFDDTIHSHVLYNRFGRPLFFSDEEKCYPHIVFQRYISSTEADALYEILCDLEQALAGSASRILFPFYDAIICEIADEDDQLPQRLRSIIENHYMDHIFYCRFPVEMKCGHDLATLH